jgi:hypothetical protein
LAGNKQDCEFSRLPSKSRGHGVPCKRLSDGTDFDVAKAQRFINQERFTVMSQTHKQKLADYLDGFVADHSMPHDGEQLVLDITPQEAQELGVSFLRVICGWALGLDQVRILREGDRPTAIPVERLISVVRRSIRHEISGMERRIMERLGEEQAVVDKEERVALRKGTYQ